MKRVHGVLVPLTLAFTTMVVGCGESGERSGSAPPATGSGGADAADLYDYVPLYPPGTEQEPPLTEVLGDGTAITRFGGRVRGRHAREVITRTLPTGTEQQGHVPGSYQGFLANYFELRTMSFEIRDESSSGGDITLTMVTPWPHDGTNFRCHFWGGTTVASYHHNGGFEFFPDESSPLPESQDDVQRVATGQWSPHYVYRATFPGHNGKRDAFGTGELNDAVGEHDGIDYDDFFRLLEFEVGVFLWEGNGIDVGQHNYYSRTYAFQMGEPGLVSWRQMDADQSWPIMAQMGMQPSDASFLDDDGDGLDDVYGNPADESHVRYATPYPSHALLGGGMTISEDTSREPDLLLMQMGLNISALNADVFVKGRRLLHTSFVDGSHSEGGNAALVDQAGKAGPDYTQTRCFDCHVSNSRSSLPRTVGAPLDRLVVKTGTGSGQPDPTYGEAIQQQGEGSVTVDGFEVIAGTYADGTPYELVRPQYDFEGGAPSAYSVRTANQFFGLGLLEAIPEATLLEFADEDDADGDGVSGRPHLTIDPENGSPRVGRFGWKAASASLRQQTASALNVDMGVTSTVYPRHECSSTNSACAAADEGGAELGDEELDLMVRYMMLLSVPPRRGFDLPEVQRGEELFAESGCTSCHRSTIETGDVHPMAELRGQVIHPYTDLLLHDLGPELADGFSEGETAPGEWRTAPLWGIGRVDDVDPDVTYLHDGRARTLSEAILWHGGEADASRDRFVAMSADDRAALLSFLESL